MRMSASRYPDAYAATSNIPPVLWHEPFRTSHTVYGVPSSTSDRRDPRARSIHDCHGTLNLHSAAFVHVDRDRGRLSPPLSTPYPTIGSPPGTARSNSSWLLPPPFRVAMDGPYLTRESAKFAHFRSE